MEMPGEVEIIRLWLAEVFKTIENVDNVEVKDFDFGPLENKHRQREKRDKNFKYKSIVSRNIKIINLVFFSRRYYET